MRWERWVVAAVLAALVGIGLYEAYKMGQRSAYAEMAVDLHDARQRLNAVEYQMSGILDLAPELKANMTTVLDSLKVVEDHETRISGVERYLLRQQR